ncbi:MAG: hypothetical protein NT151_10320 [Acidobacteria bacterium]|nr:hypothetical protein [Acidobacteriota bacterium]
MHTGREEHRFRAYVKALFSNGDASTVLERLAQLEVPPPYRCRVKVVYSAQSPETVLNGEVEAGRNLKQLGPAAYLFVKGKEQVPLAALPFPDSSVSEHVRALVSVCKSDEWRHLRSAVGHVYPRLVSILLSQSEMVRGVKALKRATGHSMIVRAFSATERLHAGTEKTRRSVRGWTAEELDSAIANFEDRQQNLTSLDVEFFPTIGEHAHIRPTATCKIRKNGEVEVSGSFRLAYSTVAAHIAEVGDRKLRYYRGRGLRESHYVPRPLSITFSRPVFDDLQNVRDFVQVLVKYPHSIHAVAHGNPYAHVAVADMFDGSSFDVWAIPPRRLALMPGLKASEAAFVRLVHHVFDRFREGQVSTYDQEERRLDGATN